MEMTVNVVVVPGVLAEVGSVEVIVGIARGDIVDENRMGKRVVRRVNLLLNCEFYFIDSPMVLDHLWQPFFE